MTTFARQAAEAAAIDPEHNWEARAQRAARLAEALASHPPGRFIDVCAGWHHTCAVEETYDIPSGNFTGTQLRCWGSNYSDAIDVGAMRYSRTNARAVSATNWYPGCERRWHATTRRPAPPPVVWGSRPHHTSRVCEGVVRAMPDGRTERGHSTRPRRRPRR